MRPSLVGAVLLSLHPGCRHAPPEPATPPPASTEPRMPEPSPPPQEPGFECGPAIEGTASLLGPGAVLLVGEMHGTTEVPALVGRLACQAARDGDGEVVVGLEIAAENQPRVDAYLGSDGSDEALTALRAAPHFTAEMKDGRSSRAMLELFESIRAWRAHGAPIHVVCYDADPGTYQSSTQRDATMAQGLLAARRARPESPLVVLSGNIHNRTKPGAPWDPDYVPMGAHLRESIPGLVSLDFRSAGGTMWVCMATPQGEPKCGEARAGGEERGPEPFVELFEAADDHGFDGVLYVGPSTASPPA